MSWMQWIDPLKLIDIGKAVWSSLDDPRARASRGEDANEKPDVQIRIRLEDPLDRFPPKTDLGNRLFVEIENQGRLPVAYYSAWIVAEGWSIAVDSSMFLKNPPRFDQPLIRLKPHYPRVFVLDCRKILEALRERGASKVDDLCLVIELSTGDRFSSNALSETYSSKPDFSDLFE